LTILLAYLLGLTEIDRGRLSYYYPGDGYTKRSGVMACDTPRRRRIYRPGSVHVAMRNARRFGCGRLVLVCAEATGRCLAAPVLDAGPWGIIRGPLKNAVEEGRWRVWRRLRPPKGWRFRAVVDLSRELWRRLGRPPVFSFVRIYRVPADVL
jgi:hypothetical protein